MSVNFVFLRDFASSSAVWRRRGGFAMGETIFMIIIVVMTLGAVFGSMHVSMNLRTRSQIDLDAFQTARACFDAIEAYGSEKVIDQDTLNEAMAASMQMLGGHTESEGLYRVRNMELRPTYTGVRGTDDRKESSIIRIDVDIHGDSNQRTRSFDYSLNVFNSEAVSYDGYKQRIR